MTVRNPLVLVSGQERELPSGDGLILNGPINMSNQGITSVANPVSTGDAANKSYVDTSTHTVNQLTTTSTALTVNKIASGTGDLLDINDDQGLPLVTTNSSGLLTANKSGVVQMASDTTVGLNVKRSSSSASTSLQQWQDETGRVMAEVDNNGSLILHGGSSSVASRLVFYANFNAVEWTLQNGDAGDELRIWNPGAGQFHWRSLPATFDVASVRPGQINPYNSLTGIKFAGLSTTPGSPTANAWSANDFFIDSKGSSQLCTATGTPGTWIAGGWQLAGFWKAGSALQTSPAVTIPTFDELMIVARIVSLSATDIPALRFNADTANNYRSRYLVNNATSGTTLTDVPAATTNMARLSGISVAGSRILVTCINNLSSAAKVGTVTSTIGTGSVSTQHQIDLAGGFEWVNTANQITSVTMLTAGGTATMATSSGFQVFGRDLA